MEGSRNRIRSSVPRNRPVRLVTIGQSYCVALNRRLADAIRSRARSSGYRDGGSMRLGDGVRVRAFRRPDGEARTLIMFDADAGGELDFEQATTVVLMTGAE